MKQRKTFSTMEIVLLIFLVGSLLASYLQARREEEGERA
jgi:uncharacterized membrane protein affecting hemolysin expression